MLNKVWANTHVHARADTKNVQTSLKTKGSCNRAWILMKNSNNIKWGVSTADTLLLRALQTDRVTRYTHYAATVQPLSVMMMAALTGAAFKTPLLQTLASNGRVNLRFVARGERKKKKKQEEWGVAVSGPVFFPTFYLPTIVTGPLFLPPLRLPPFSSDHFIVSRAPERCRLRYQRRRIPTATAPPPERRTAVIPPDRRALEAGLRFSHPSVSPHLQELEKETAHINMWTSPRTLGGRAWRRRERPLCLKATRVAVCLLFLKVKWEQVCRFECEWALKLIRFAQKKHAPHSLFCFISLRFIFWFYFI